MERQEEVEEQEEEKGEEQEEQEEFSLRMTGSDSRLPSFFRPLLKKRKREEKLEVMFPPKAPKAPVSRLKAWHRVPTPPWKNNFHPDTRTFYFPSSYFSSSHISSSLFCSYLLSSSLLSLSLHSSSLLSSSLLSSSLISSALLSSSLFSSPHTSTAPHPSPGGGRHTGVGRVALV